MPASPSRQQRFEGDQGVYEVTAPEPVLLGRVSVFYSARDVKSGESVYVKSFRGAFRGGDELRGFYREIDALRRLRHPHVLKIVDYGTGSAAAPPFLVLPVCRGGNLRGVMEGSQFLPIAAAIGILEQVATAIDFAHHSGIIHGDIKPENILFSEDRSQAFLADFGMARYFDIEDRVRISSPLAESRGAGTSAYLSPEQLNEKRQSPLSDIYSFALVAYELVTGRLPFDAEAPLYRQIKTRVEGNLVDPREANPALSEPARRALLRGLSVQPQDRPKTAAEFCMLLQQPEQRPDPGTQAGGQVVFQGPAFIAEMGVAMKKAVRIEKVEHVTDRTINIGAGATISAPITIADQIEGSFNALARSDVDNDLRVLLELLLKQVAAAGSTLPVQQAQQMARDADALAKEVAGGKPRRRFYEVTLDGLKEAAVAVGELGKPILATVTKLLPLLVTLFP